MKFKYIHFNSMRNDEHYQFVTEFKDLVTLRGSDNLKIVNEFEVFLVCYENEDMSLKLITKSSVTDDIANLDHLRDITFRGMVDTNTAALNHYDPTVAAAARRLKVVTDTYGNLAAKPLNEETSGIHNILQDFMGKYSADVQKVGLGGWINSLMNYNNSMEGLVKQRNDENAAKTHLRMKECRVETDKAYAAIIERIGAFIVIEGETAYSEFVNKLNSFIDKYNNIIAQRAGRAKAKKEA